MPIIKSAIKRVRQTTKRTARNARVKRQLKESTKALSAAIESKQTAKLPTLMNELNSHLDVAVKKNLIPKNRAARTKSRYAGLVKQAGGKVAPSAKQTSGKNVTSKPAAKKTTAKKSQAKKPAAKKTPVKKK